MITITSERSFHGQAIEALYDRCFGDNRHTKSSYTLRTGRSPLSSLAKVATFNRPGDDHKNHRVIGAVRFWEVQVQCLISGRVTRALLLGPFAIDPEYQGKHLGRALMSAALKDVDNSPYDLTVLVGDFAYYQRFGFQSVKPRTITLPDGRDADRLLYRLKTGLTVLPSVGVIKPRSDAKLQPYEADLQSVSEQRSL